MMGGVGRFGALLAESSGFMSIGKLLSGLNFTAGVK